MSQAETAGTAAEVTTQPTSEALADTPSEQQGGTVLTGGEASGKDGATDGQTETTKDTEQTKPDDPAALVPEAPDGYALTFQDGVNVDKGLLGNFQQAAHKLGLNQGQAQELANLYAADAAEKEKAQAQAMAETQRTWEAEIKNTATFSEDCRSARATLIEFGSFGHVNEKGEPALHPELKEIFDDTLIGSHPKVFSMFAAIGKALAEPTVRGSGAGSGDGLNFYPSMNKQ